MALCSAQVYVHRLRRYIGAYLVQLEGRVDAIIFSAGMGENNALLRGRALQGLQVVKVSTDMLTPVPLSKGTYPVSNGEHGQ